MLKWEWNPEAIWELFYESGRMSKLPTIYKPIGRIVKYWPEIEVISVEISEDIQDTLRKGDRLGYVTPEGYLEEEASSLEIENQPVVEAFPGQRVGIKTEYPKERLHKGTPVCKVMEQVPLT
jgi:hypothetical protein